MNKQQLNGIRWCDYTWNPIAGCSHISEGCVNCYAAGISDRFGLPWGVPELRRERLVEPGRTKPFAELTGRQRDGWIAFRRSRGWPEHMLESPFLIFVCSMSDIFHEKVTDNHRDEIFARIALSDGHDYLLLTKRVEQAARYYKDYPSMAEDGNIAFELGCGDLARECCEKWNLPGDNYNNIVGVDETQATGRFVCEELPPLAFPLANVWLGVTAENQQRFNERVRVLLGIDAVRHFVSMEPLLEGVDASGLLRGHDQCNVSGVGLDWVIAGPETGPGARPCLHQWIDSLGEQCAQAGVPFFDKRRIATAKQEFPKGRK